MLTCVIKNAIICVIKNANIGVGEEIIFMNEGMAVFLNMDAGRCEGTEDLIRKIDELLLNYGMKYTGYNNIYKPIEEKSRDHVVFAACRALRKTDWLKDKLAYISIMNRTGVCSMERVRLEDMAELSAAKLEYYESYYQKSHTLAHGIVVDEYGRMRDGYASYMIARKYGVHPDIYEAYAEQPLKKIVRGQHILKVEDTWKIKSDKIYVWNYSLRSPVVPGDILRVQAKSGQALICVRQIDYVTGEEFCREHRNVVKHMKVRML